MEQKEPLKIKSSSNVMKTEDDDVFLQTIIDELATLPFEHDAEMSEHISFIAACRHDTIDVSKKEKRMKKKVVNNARHPSTELKTLFKYSMNATTSSVEEDIKRKERILEHLKKLPAGKHLNYKEEVNGRIKPNIIRRTLEKLLPPIGIYKKSSKSSENVKTLNIK